MPLRGKRPGIPSAIAERQGGADKTSDSGGQVFWTRRRDIAHTVRKNGNVSSSNSFKANVAWEEFCVLWLEVVGSI